MPDHALIAALRAARVVPVVRTSYGAVGPIPPAEAVRAALTGRA